MQCIINRQTSSSACPLFCQYQGQHQPQQAFIYLDCDSGRLGADYSGEIGNGVPFTVYHHRELRWSIDCHLTEDAINRRLDYIEPLAQRILDGYDTSWNGSNMVGTYTDDAREAIEEIGQWLEEEGASEDEMGTVVTCADYLQYNTFDEIWPDSLYIDRAAQEIKDSLESNWELADDPIDYLLDEAEHRFSREERLADAHLAALLEYSRVTPEQVAEYEASREEDDAEKE